MPGRGGRAGTVPTNGQLLPFGDIALEVRIPLTSPGCWKEATRRICDRSMTPSKI